MFSFTPGPWKAHTITDTRYSGSPWSGDEKVTGHSEHYVVIAPRQTDKETVLVAEINTSVRNPWRFPSDQLADARLIAAAPDMIALLVDLLPMLPPGSQVKVRCEDIIEHVQNG